MVYEAFPLQWPLGYERSENRLSSSFKITADKARKDLLNEVLLLSKDKNPVISSNVPLRKRDGQMYADVANDELEDPGVAIYFVMNGESRVLACDAWLTPAENIRALGLTINAMRGMDRWKCSEILKRTFSGFPSLPEITTAETDIWLILGLNVKPENVEKVKEAYRSRLAIVHPDKPGGSDAAFIQLQDAYNKALKFYNL